LSEESLFALLHFPLFAWRLAARRFIETDVRAANSRDSLWTSLSSSPVRRPLRLAIFGRPITVWMFCATGARFGAVLFNPPMRGFGESCRSSLAKSGKIKGRQIAV